MYLHQVFERRRSGRRAFADLPDALAAFGDGGPDEAEWRIHFHVPVFRPEIGPFATTQPVLRALLADVRRRAITAHLEVETYAFGVLPAEHRATTLVTSLVRELRWVLEELGA